MNRAQRFQHDQNTENLELIKTKLSEAEDLARERKRMANNEFVGEMIQQAIDLGAEPQTVADLANELSRGNAGNARDIMAELLGEEPTPDANESLLVEDAPEPVAESNPFEGLSIQEIIASPEYSAEQKETAIKNAYQQAHQREVIEPNIQKLEAKQTRIDVVQSTESRTGFQEALANATSQKERGEIIANRWRELEQAFDLE